MGTHPACGSLHAIAKNNDAAISTGAVKAAISPPILALTTPAVMTRGLLVDKVNCASTTEISGQASFARRLSFVVDKIDCPSPPKPPRWVPSSSVRGSLRSPGLGLGARPLTFQNALSGP
jgi:hypothetical protein